MVDWIKIKSEYIRDPSKSYRILSKEHGVSLSSLSKKAAKEKWADLRIQTCNKVETKMAESAAEAQLRSAQKLYNAADLLLDMILDGIEKKEIRLNTVKNIRDITGALKDIKDVQGAKGKIDLDEQLARIDKLRKEAQDEANVPEKIEVIISGALEEYAK